MSAASLETRREPRTDTLPGYIFHPSFVDHDAKGSLDPKDLLQREDDFGDRYMPDDVTKDYARRMHYAAYRMHQATRSSDRARWQRAYFALRDHIVLGNRKLIYRAVRRRMSMTNRTDDTIGDCHIVLIQAVAAFNPWLGIRFSTYAYTCLVRALSRLSQRWGTDWLLKAVSFDLLPDGEPNSKHEIEPSGAAQIQFDEFLKDDHPLLSSREKAIIAQRFSLGDDHANCTLEKVGKTLGLSKERVRQVQASALDKLRKALSPSFSEAK